MKRLDGKVVIITGAAGGIGSAAARRFAGESARLLLVDREAAALQRLTAELQPGEAAAHLVADVAEEASGRAYVAEATRRFGRVDALLLNAGIEGEVGRIEDVPLAAFDRVISVNVRSVWIGLAAAMPAMRAAGGSIVVTSSVAGLRGSAMLAAYSASKHAVVGMAKSAALEGAADGIRVNVVCPAQTQTRMILSIDESMRVMGRKVDPVARIPAGRYADPDEIAGLMLFLASDESRFCTGATYLIDGGTMS